MKVSDVTPDHYVGEHSTKFHPGVVDDCWTNQQWASRGGGATARNSAAATAEYENEPKHRYNKISTVFSSLLKWKMENTKKIRQNADILQLTDC